MNKKFLFYPQNYAIFTYLNVLKKSMLSQNTVSIDFMASYALNVHHIDSFVPRS